VPSPGLCGVTSNLVMQHKKGTLGGFTADFGCKRLLYFEGWRRAKKLNPIRMINPEFKDLKRGCVVAENVDVGPGQMLASSWFSAPGKNRGGPGG
jgi:hypothetical protein